MLSPNYRRQEREQNAYNDLTASHGTRAGSPTQSSKRIIKDVFTSKIPLPSSPTQSLIFSHSRTKSPEPASLAIHLPVLPPNISPSAKAAHYLRYLDNEQYEIALHALEEIRRLIPQCKGAFEIVRHMARVLTRYPALRTSFTYLLVDTIALFDLVDSPVVDSDSTEERGQKGKEVEWPFEEALGVVAQVLLDDSIAHPFIRRAAIRCLIKMGKAGISFLVEFATTSGFGELQELVLNTLAYQSQIQECTVMKMFKRELTKTSSGPDTRASAVMAVSRLYDKATPLVSSLLPILLDMFEQGVVNRDILSLAIRNCGEPGEVHLIKLLLHPNYRVRACSAVALGQLLCSKPTYLKISLLFVSVVCYFNFDIWNIKIKMDDNEIMKAPSSSPTYLSNGDDILGIEWDGRTFAGLINTALQEGLLHANLQVVDLPGNYSELVENTDNVLSQNNFLPMSGNVVKALCQSLSEDSDTNVKIATAASLMNSESSMISLIHPVLYKALGDSVPAVREQAAKTIGNFGPAMGMREIVSLLTSLLRDEFYQVRHAACIALGKIKTGETNVVLPELLRLLQHNTVNRSDVAMSIACFGKDAEAVLINVVSTPLIYNTPSRSAAVSALSSINLEEISAQRSENIVNCLYTNAKDSVPSIRIACSSAVAQLGLRYSKLVQALQSTRVLPFLYGMLFDKESSVREAIAEQIAALWEEGGELLLVEGLLKDSSPVIREASAYGLTIIGPRSTRSLLLALSDQEERVKEAAAQGLLKIGLQRILTDLAMRPQHYLESLAHFCDAALASPALRLRTGRNAFSDTHGKRRNYAGTHQERRAASPSPGASDLLAFLETLRTQVVIIASLK